VTPSQVPICLTTQGICLYSFSARCLRQLVSTLRLAPC
jgi:hypothetical protein